MDPAPNPLATAAFGRFQVVPHRRELLADGKPLKLGGRAFDVLMTLIETPGAIVSSDVLMARVWPNRVVEESALHVQISALRAALGRERGLIRTVTGSLVPVLWLQGFPDQAMAMARAYVEDAHATGHQVSLCWALYAACPIALAIGDLATADRFVAMLHERSSRHAPGFLQALAHGLHGELLIKRGEADRGVQRLRIALDELRASGFVLRRPALLGTLAEGLAAAGRVAEGLQAVKAALAQCERSEEMWNIAELLRIEGELLWLEGTPQAIAAAEDRFRQALVWARRQEASSWELRCATSFARLLNEQRRTGEARQLLSVAYERFTEGFETADLKAAKALLASLPDLPAEQWVEDGCGP
jgi:hypothetical protein